MQLFSFLNTLIRLVQPQKHRLHLQQVSHHKFLVLNYFCWSKCHQNIWNISGEEKQKHDFTYNISLGAEPLRARGLERKGAKCNFLSLTLEWNELKNEIKRTGSEKKKNEDHNLGQKNGQKPAGLKSESRPERSWCSVEWTSRMQPVSGDVVKYFKLLIG